MGRSLESSRPIMSPSVSLIFLSLHCYPVVPLHPSDAAYLGHYVGSYTVPLESIIARADAALLRLPPIALPIDSPPTAGYRLPLPKTPLTPPHLSPTATRACKRSRNGLRYSTASRVKVYSNSDTYPHPKRSIVSAS